MTPTYGVASRYGLISFANSLDKIGPLTRTVEGAAAALDVVSGKDPKDQTSVKSEGNYREAVKKNVEGMKIGLPKEYLDAADEEIREKVMEAVGTLEDLGCTYKKVSTDD